jgi:very-short-patch-repair endonuclease
MAPKKGSIPWNKGKKLSVEHCENLSSAHMGQSAWNKGLQGATTRTTESKEAFSKYAKEHGFGKWSKGRKPWNAGLTGVQEWDDDQRRRFAKWVATPEAQEAFKRQGTYSEQGLMERDTAPELGILALLESIGVEYVRQVPLADITVADFYLPKQRIVIYADGNYWHHYPEGRQKDRDQVEVLTKLGFAVLRFWESDIEKDKIGTLHQILKVIKNRS